LAIRDDAAEGPHRFPELLRLRDRPAVEVAVGAGGDAPLLADGGHELRQVGGGNALAARPPQWFISIFRHDPSVLEFVALVLPRLAECG
jgi:hypothetical protein